MGADLVTAFYRMESLELWAKITINAVILGGSHDIRVRIFKNSLICAATMVSPEDTPAIRNIPRKAKGFNHGKACARP